MDARNIPNPMGSNQQEISFTHQSFQKERTSKQNQRLHCLLYESLLIGFIACACCLMCSLFHQVGAGLFGQWIATQVLSKLNYAGYLVPFELIWLAATSHFALRGKLCISCSFKVFVFLKLFSAMFTLLSTSTLLSFFVESLGGQIGDYLSGKLIESVGNIGTGFILLSSILISISLLTGISWFDALGRVGRSNEPPNRDNANLNERELSLDNGASDVSSVSDQFSINDYQCMVNDTVEAKIERFLLEFGIRSRVVNTVTGPVITRFEIALAAGVKSSQVESLAKDLARLLSVDDVRIANVPGRNTLGIEVPNAEREKVRFSELVHDPEFVNPEARLPLLLGEDSVGQTVVADLAIMPHLIIAGTTGSGKSMSINAMILGLISRLGADQLKFVLIDPKMLDFSVFDSLPHLLTPVITDMADAAGVLNWCVSEMEKRYALLNQAGSRNINDYNELSETPLPRIVIVADEFADMMMSVGTEIESLVVKLAQKARAAGIHLILSTQRPTTDVITGLIKSNIPSRISFAVASGNDSRIILDQNGAEKLLGKGDMLFLEPGKSVPSRLQAPYVSDKDFDSVLFDLSKEPNNQFQLCTLPVPQKDNVDELYNDALDFAYTYGEVSIKKIQRQFAIGYTRAARIVDQMVEAGILGEQIRNEPRKVIGLRVVG